MRLPSHLTLDFERKHNSSVNWLTKLINEGTSIETGRNNPVDSIIFKKFILKNSTNNALVSGDMQYTVNYLSSLGLNPNSHPDTYYNHLFNKVQVLFSSGNLKNFSTFKNSSLLPSMININFLRKERLYTKLKYSRSPAYDIVSGGAAALLAGFIGFLISEKYGFELVDSGDFYYLFMYLVFLSFSVRPLLTSVHYSEGVFKTLSIRFVLEYYVLIFHFFLMKIKYR